MASALAGGLQAESTDAATAERPNVIVVMTDDQSKDTIEVMSRTRRALGGRGTTFSRAYVDFPLCCPSRATFLTGKHSHRHRIRGNSLPHGGFARWEPTHGDDNLATWLQDSGYATAFVGKFFNGYPVSGYPRNYVPPGWTEWYASVHGPWHSYDYSLNENGRIVSYGNAESDYRTDVLTGHSVDLIDRLSSGQEPFFMWVSYNAPHEDYVRGDNPQEPGDCNGTVKPAPRHANAFDDAPLPRPPSFNEADVSDKPPSISNRPELDQASIEALTRKYRCGIESLLSVDEGVEGIVNALEASGELDNTLIAFTTDHGWFYGEHRLPGGKSRHYRPASEVPLIIRGPGIPAGAENDALTSNVDLAPTIIDAAKVPARDFDGISLLPMLRDGDRESSQRALLIQALSYTAIRTERFVYVEHKHVEWNGDGGSRELYDLPDDPYQLESRHDDPRYAQIKANLASRLDKLRSCAGPSCYERELLDTTIADAPAGLSNEKDPEFGFTGSEPHSFFECRLGGASSSAWQDCESPKSYASLDDGDYVFAVRSRDPDGNVDGSPARHAFRVDTRIARVKARAPGSQRQRLKRPLVRLRVRAREPVRAVMTGRIIARAKRGHKVRRYRLRRRARAIERDEVRKLRNTTPNRKRGRALVRRINRGQSARARIVVRAKDAAGNRTKRTIRVRLR